MFIPTFHRSNIVSYLGILTSVLATCFFLNAQINVGMICFVISGIADLFDGVFARRFKRSVLQQKIGVQIDSLADIISFVMVPVVLLATVNQTSIWLYAQIFVYAFCAIARLSYFNVMMETQDTNVSITHFIGLPVTYSALAIGLVYTSGTLIMPNLVIPLLNVTMIGLSFLYVLKIKIPKPRGIAYILFSLLAVAVIGCLIFLI